MQKPYFRWVKSPFGQLNFFDVPPHPETGSTAYDALDLMHGTEAFLGAIPRAWLEAMRRGQRAAGGDVGSHHRHTVAWSV
jgi:hypothetical protein